MKDQIAQIFSYHIAWVKGVIKSDASELFVDVDPMDIVAEILADYEKPIYIHHLNTLAKFHCIVALQHINLAEDAAEREDYNEALAFTISAAFQIAICEDSFDSEKLVSDKARKAAQIRNKEYIAMKADVIAYYKANRNQFNSKDEAAHELSGKYVNAPFSTVRKWLKNV